MIKSVAWLGTNMASVALANGTADKQRLAHLFKVQDRHGDMLAAQGRLLTAMATRQLATEPMSVRGGEIMRLLLALVQQSGCLSDCLVNKDRDYSTLMKHKLADVVNCFANKHCLPAHCTRPPLPAPPCVCACQGSCRRPCTRRRCSGWAD